MLFGARLSEIFTKSGKVHENLPVFGTVDMMEMHMINFSPGAPLPDLFQAVIFPTE
jgi:hypothetical protein